MQILEYNSKFYLKGDLKHELLSKHDYISYERDIYDNTGYDVVLVGADKVSDLKKAYPNYFLDTREFMKLLKKICN